MIWRWLPWLLSFGGARPGDILEATGDDFLHVKTVNDEEIRYILLKGRTVLPWHMSIHSGLVQMGLLDKALPKKSRPFFDGTGPSSTADEIFARYRRKLNSMKLIPDEVPLVSGLRNNFASKSDRYGGKPELIPFLMGRSLPPSEYNDGSGQLRASSQAVAKLPIPVVT